MLESLFNKVAGLKAFNFIKKHSNTGFSCEYYKIFKNTILKNISKWLLWIQHVLHKYKAEETHYLQILETFGQNILFIHIQPFHGTRKNAPRKNVPGKSAPRI